MQSSVLSSLSSPTICISLSDHLRKDFRSSNYLCVICFFILKTRVFEQQRQRRSCFYSFSPGPIHALQKQGHREEGMGKTGLSCGSLPRWPQQWEQESVTTPGLLWGQQEHSHVDCPPGLSLPARQQEAGSEVGKLRLSQRSCRMSALQAVASPTVPQRRNPRQENFHLQVYSAKTCSTQSQTKPNAASQGSWVDVELRHYLGDCDVGCRHARCCVGWYDRYTCQDLVI